MSDDLMLEIGTAANLAGIETLEKSLDALKQLARKAAEEVEGVGGDKKSPFDIPKDGITGKQGKEAISFLGRYRDQLRQTGAVMASSLALGSGFNKGVFRSLMSTFGGAGLTAGIMAHGFMESAAATDQLNKKLINLGLDPKFAQEMIHVSKLMKGTEDDAFQLQKTLKNLFIRQTKLFDFGAATELAEITGRDTMDLFSSSDAQERTRNLRKFMSDLDSSTQDAVGQLLGLSETNLMLLKSTSKEFDALRSKARQVALSISDRDLKAAEHLEDSLANAGASWSKLMQPLNTSSIERMAKITDVVGNSLDSMYQGIENVNKAVEENQKKTFTEKGAFDFAIDAGEVLSDFTKNAAMQFFPLQIADALMNPKPQQQKPQPNVTINSPITINMQRPDARPQDVAAEVRKEMGGYLTNWAAGITSGGF